MADDAQNRTTSSYGHTSAPTITSVNWREIFPFLHLFRAFRIAVHPSKLILGLLALLVLYAGGRTLDALWPAAHSANYSEVSEYEAYSNSARSRAGAFRDTIEQTRRLNQQAYATQLREIVHDPSKVASESASFARRGDLEDRIIGKRDEAIAAADKALEAAVKSTDTQSETAALDPNVSEARRVHAAAVAAAMYEARAETATLRSFLPRGVFDAFFGYESEQVERVVYGVRNSNWTGGMRSSVTEPAAMTYGDALGLPTRFSGRNEFSEIAASAAPQAGVVVAVQNFVITGPGWLLRYHTIFFLIYFVLFLLVWSVFGGAISRIAAVHAARDEKISVRQALRFSSNKVLSFIFAPLIPLGIVLLIGLLIATGGLLFYIPWVGPILGGLCMVFALLGGVLITLILVGTVGGFNLMYPTIAAEGSDSFDAISRSFSYIYARPWRMIFYTAVSIAYGALTYIFVKLFIYLVLAVTHYFVGLWLVASPGRWFPEMWPAPDPLTLPYSVNFAGLKFTEKAAAFLICFWNYLLIGLLGAFVISFYFSSSTIIYFLMRREVDATDIVDVYVEEADDDLSEPAPVSASEPAPAPSENLGGTASDGLTPAT